MYDPLQTFPQTVTRAFTSPEVTILHVWSLVRLFTSAHYSLRVQMDGLNAENKILACVRIYMVNNSDFVLFCFYCETTKHTYTQERVMFSAVQMYIMLN